MGWGVHCTQSPPSLALFEPRPREGEGSLGCSHKGEHPRPLSTLVEPRLDWWVHPYLYPPATARFEFFPGIFRYFPGIPLRIFSRNILVFSRNFFDYPRVAMALCIAHAHHIICTTSFAISFFARLAIPSWNVLILQETRSRSINKVKFASFSFSPVIDLKIKYLICEALPFHNNNVRKTNVAFHRETSWYCKKPVLVLLIRSSSQVFQSRQL